MATVYPKCLPDWILADPKRSAEVAVFNALRDGLPSEFRVYYHFPWTHRTSSNPRASEGEADFVVAHADKGILLIEVKGGRIRYDGATGQWTTTDRESVTHEINPFEQLRRCKHALLDKLRATRAWGNRWIEIAQAVAFPHCASGKLHLTADAPSQTVICGDDLSRLEPKIAEVFQYWCDNKAAQPLEGGQLAALEQVIAPAFELPDFRMGFDMSAQEQRILQLTQEQFDVLEILQQVPRVAVQGGAGTGKTFLAIEKARRAHRDGRRTLLLCFNRPLAEFIQRSLESVPEVQVCTFHQFCYRAAKNSGSLLADPYSQEQPARYYEADMPMALFSGIAEHPELRFDTLIIDEGQDFLAGWWDVLEYLFGDASQGELYIFHDNNQNIYGGRRSAFPKSLVPISLTRNLRNSRQVHDLVRRLYRGGEFQPSGPDGAPVEFIEAATPQDIRKATGKVLHRLIHENHLPPSYIAVLSGKSLLSCSLAGQETIGTVRLTSGHHEAAEAVLLETIHRFKGLEKPVVILIDLDDIRSSKEMLYVGLSRARVQLIVVAAKETLRQISTESGEKT